MLNSVVCEHQTWGTEQLEVKMSDRPVDRPKVGLLSWLKEAIACPKIRLGFKVREPWSWYRYSREDRLE